VVRGDTLYSIAWESGRDFRDLAAWNGIPPPYLLQPGQEIRLQPPAGAVATPAGRKPEAVAAKPAETAKPGKAAPPAPAKPPATSTKPATKPSPPAETQPAPAARPAPARPPETAGSEWAWPAQGKLLARFSDGANNKGIDIGGTTGQPVLAAAAGRVVYQGSGLRGYGQLIIVKHSDEFLSAYAHNDRIYVKEGDMVKRGQKIAAMGSTGADRVKLHFEIRRNGVPVDPLRHLPRQ
jgi:lipoprotein NlpD